MKLCECHGSFSVRPLPGYKCGKCDLYIVGPPGNRNTDLSQTPRRPERNHRVRGIAGARFTAPRAETYGRRMTASYRKQQRGKNPSNAEALKADKVAFGAAQLDKLIARQEAKLKARIRHRRKRHRARRRLAAA